MHPNVRRRTLIAACLVPWPLTLSAQSPALRWRDVPQDSAASILTALNVGELRIKEDSVHPRVRLLQRDRELMVRGHFTMPSLTQQLHGWVVQHADTVALVLFSVQVGQSQPRAVYEAVFEAVIGPLSVGSHKLVVYWVKHGENPQLLTSGSAQVP